MSGVPNTSYRQDFPHDHKEGSDAMKRRMCQEEKNDGHIILISNTYTRKKTAHMSFSNTSFTPTEPE
eukprot:CAMPEP_0201506966 /NCGR_PEP_ID=MMETSP0161_2-20130828/786_1 /ASSEMBLY_ACC=CAM_ASM_000251 /TAXON_ID=180227 /ORGANISM="Neoparamoeba aestuarina, Strain SoJaBio B1-5/56/2" /LENGTH=66 /DNA_ID=CAMNT_0047901217 /DNA_START=57 /DNA_END=257 /DNA_ORIENTATION=+